MQSVSGAERGETVTRGVGEPTRVARAHRPRARQARAAPAGVAPRRQDHLLHHHTVVEFTSSWRTGGASSDASTHGRCSSPA